MGKKNESAYKLFRQKQNNAFSAEVVIKSGDIHAKINDV